MACVGRHKWRGVLKGFHRLFHNLWKTRWVEKWMVFKDRHLAPVTGHQGPFDQANLNQRRQPAVDGALGRAERGC